jgi:outer membrane protein
VIIPNLRRAGRLLGMSLLLGATAVAAQTPAPAAPLPDAPLTAEECVRIALERNPSAAAILHSGRSVLARVGLSQSAYYPTLNLSGGLSRSYSEPSGSTGSGRNGLVFSSATSTSDSALLSADYTVWDSGQRKAAVGEAKANYQAADANYIATLQNLALSVETAYYNMQGALWVLEVAKDTLKQADFHLEMAQARNDVGLVPRSDVLKAATAQADARLAVIQAQAQLETARATLASLMGLPSDSMLQLVAANREFVPPQLPDWASNWAKAQESLPEIKLAFQDSESFRYAYLGAKAAYLPTVSASGTAGLFDSGNWPNRQEWSAGLTLRVPIFTGYARKYLARQAKESWESSQANFQATVLSSEKAAYGARITLDAAIQAVPAAEAYVASAQENMDVANGQYKNGLGSMLDVNDALAALSAAKLRLIQARLNVATATVAWKRATGVDLLEGVPLPPIAPQRPDGDQKP